MKLRKILEGGNDDKESIRVLIEDFEYLCARYDYLAKELKEAVYGSSSSSSDSDDYYPKKNGGEQEAKSLVKDIGKLIVSKNEEIDQLKDDVEDLQIEVEVIREDLISALVRGAEKHRKEVEAEAKMTSAVRTVDQMLKEIRTLRVNFEGHFRHLKSKIFEMSNELTKISELKGGI